MGRPRLPVGSYGNISYRDLGPKRVRAMANVRDPDGRTRQVTALGTSKTHAKTRLLEAISARVGWITGADLAIMLPTWGWSSSGWTRTINPASAEQCVDAGSQRCPVGDVAGPVSSANPPVL